ncbi:MAG: aminotransferase class I/II-fold pyridoxal phosphate-dependent enzyme [Defluviitaleaceae bacterium]|nr:aminotransferase class I/II-fold pyridoxal phosphate-dependent enzyme [Defluviitaleaceae bacterium]
MDKILQQRAPIMEAMEALRNQRVVPFDVPGHKRGKGNPELTEFFGAKTMSIDVNSMKPLDFLGHPVSVIKEAEEIAADAFGAAHAFLMVSGTSASVIAMIMAACKKGDKILMPRNVHKSVLSALILSGALPVYIDPGLDINLGVSMGMSIADIARAIDENPDAAAIFLNNPTYYGICSNLPEIVKMARAKGIAVLVDEAHGTHFSFGRGLPISAMAAGADMSAVSMHKSGGSLTQSSFLLLGAAPNPHHVRQIINLTQTTSASYLLMVSLDISRKNLALNGVEIFDKVGQMANYARDEINNIGGYYAFGKEIINGDAIFDFDHTKLSVNTLKTGLAGREVYDILRDEYDIQIEFGDIGNFLAYVSVGDRMKDIERLCSSLSEIYRRYGNDKKADIDYEYIHPVVAALPQEAFYAEKEAVRLENSAGRISSELVMCYPPGIPIIAPGEMMTQAAVDYIRYAKEVGCSLTGTQDEDVEMLYVLK